MIDAIVSAFRNLVDSRNTGRENVPNMVTCHITLYDYIFSAKIIIIPQLALNEPSIENCSNYVWNTKGKGAYYKILIV
jgi:hypothetical protein